MNSLRNKKLLSAFGSHLKKIRENKNISQQKLGLECNSFQSTIIRIEQGKTDPKLSTLFAISEKLDISLGKLFDEFNLNETKTINP